MKKEIIFLSIILLISAACTLSGQKGSQAQNDAITMNFLTNQPPTELYDSQNFRVGLNIKNYAQEKKDVFVCVFDELSDYFNGIPANTCKDVKLDASELSGDNILPSDKRVYWPGEDQTYMYEKITGSMSTSIFAELTYQHKTVSTAQICVKRDIEAETSGVKCDVDSQEQVTNNDAPIKISNLEKRLVPLGKNKVSVLLNFVITNVGSGKVQNKKSLKSRDNIDPAIDIAVNLVGKTNSFKCNPTRDDGKILLKENQKTIKCEAPVDMEEPFSMVPLEITLDYGYDILTSVGPINLIGKEGGK